MLKCTQEIVEWKRLRSTNVSESYDLCRQLCYLALDEAERLSWDLFLLEKQQDIDLHIGSSGGDHESVCAWVGLEYTKYLGQQLEVSDDDRRCYFFHYIIVAREYRMFCEAMRKGDAIMQEHIMHNFVGVFLLLGKSKYVEITLNQIERHYGDIEYGMLQEIRMNGACRYREGTDSNGKEYPLKVLDEVMDNVNGWEKKMLLGTNELAWTIHTPNLMCARRAISFEEGEYCRARMDFQQLIEGKTPSECPTRQNAYCTSTVESRKTRERVRVYEWMCRMFVDEESKRSMTTHDAMSMITELDTPLKLDVESDDGDDLHVCVTDILNEGQGLDDLVDISVAGEHLDFEQEGDLDSDIELMDVDSVEVTCEQTSPMSHSSDVHRLSLRNVFVAGKHRLMELDVPNIRKRRKLRINREEEYLLELIMSPLKGACISIQPSK